MTVPEHNILVEKAKSKNDGVYSWNNYLYVVKSSNFIAYSDYSGNISSVHGVFHMGIGKVERYDRRKKLVEYLRSL